MRNCGQWTNAGRSDIAVGPVSGNGLTLPPKTTTELPLKGTIIYRDDEAGTAALGEVFSMFLLGENVPLTVTGDSVITPAQPNRPVSWLSAAFKTLVLNVTLPGYAISELIGSSMIQTDAVFCASFQSPIRHHQRRKSRWIVFWSVFI